MEMLVTFLLIIREHEVGLNWSTVNLAQTLKKTLEAAKDLQLV